MFDFKIIPVDKKGSENCILECDGFKVTVGFGASCLALTKAFHDGSYTEIEVYGPVGDKNTRIHMINGRRVPR